MAINQDKLNRVTLRVGELRTSIRHITNEMDEITDMLMDISENYSDELDLGLVQENYYITVAKKALVEDYISPASKSFLEGVIAHFNRVGKISENQRKCIITTLPNRFGN